MARNKGGKRKSNSNDAPTTRKKSSGGATDSVEADKREEGEIATEEEEEEEIQILNVCKTDPKKEPSLRKKNKALHEELNVLKQKLEQQQKEVEKIKQARSENNKAKETISRLEKVCNDLISEKATIQARAEKAECALKIAGVQPSLIEKMNIDLNSQIADLKENVEKLKEDLKSTQAELKCTKAGNALAAAAAAAAESTVAAAAVVAALPEPNHAATAAPTAAPNGYAANAVKDALRCQVHSLEKDNKKLIEELKMEKEKNAGLSREMESMQKREQIIIEEFNLDKDAVRKEWEGERAKDKEELKKVKEELEKIKRVNALVLNSKNGQTVHELASKNQELEDKAKKAIFETEEYLELKKKYTAILSECNQLKQVKTNTGIQVEFGHAKTRIRDSPSLFNTPNNSSILLPPPPPPPALLTTVPPPVFMPQAPPTAAQAPSPSLIARPFINPFHPNYNTALATLAGPAAFRPPGYATTVEKDAGKSEKRLPPIPKRFPSRNTV